MNKIKAVIIEDEYPAARLLHEMLTALRPEWNIQILPGTIEDAVEWYSCHPHPDITFLDIQLTDGNSFIFIERAQPQGMIVFTTAFDQYAIQAFSVNSIDYLLKPIHEERLQETLVKFESLREKYLVDYNQENKLLEVLQNISNPNKKYRTRFLISRGEKLFTLQVTDIAYFFSENKTTFAVTRERNYIVDLPLDKLGEQLNPDLFFRANRQIILGIECIQRIEPYFNNKIIVHTLPEFKDHILVSREKATAFKMWLNY